MTSHTADMDGDTEREEPWLCDGCNVREPWEHRCCGDDGAWRGDPPCECPRCTGPQPTLDEMRAELGIEG